MLVSFVQPIYCFIFILYLVIGNTNIFVCLLLISLPRIVLYNGGLCEVFLSWVLYERLMLVRITHFSMSLVSLNLRVALYKCSITVI